MIQQELNVLRHHIRRQDLNAIKKYLNDHNRINLNEKDSNGRTILYDVVQSVNADILHYFLSLTNSRFKINDVDNMNMTILDFLFSLKTRLDLEPCHQVLLKAGAQHYNNNNKDFRYNYTGNSYHLYGDLPSWNISEAKQVNRKQTNHINKQNKSSKDSNMKEKKNENTENYYKLLMLIISYVIIILFSAISKGNSFWPLLVYGNAIVNCNNWFSAKIFYINSIANIKNDLFLVDCMMALLTGLVLLHIYLKTKWNGTMVSIIILCITVVAEQLSIQLGETHCHFEALVMVTKCSSLNSIIFYLPWMYSCYFIGQHINFPTKRGKLLFIGLIHPIFCTMYELTGANNQRWWSWGSKIPALNERYFEVPIMAVAFHYFYGLCFAATYDKVITMKINTLIQIGLCIIIPPTAACLMLTSFALFVPLGFTNFMMTFALLLGSFIVILYDWQNNTEINSKNIKNKQTKDYMLLSIPFLFFTFVLLLQLTALDLGGHIEAYQIVLFVNILLGYIGLAIILFYSRRT
jgi:hypothetical protein